MRCLITTIGSSGDINPYIAIGRELLARGHEVEMLVNPHYEARIRACGFAFRPLGTEAQLLNVLHHPDLARQNQSPLLIIRELIGETVDPTIAGVEASIREFKPDCIVRHHISLGSRWVAQREKIPCITGTLAPIFWFSRKDPSVQYSFEPENIPQWRSSLRTTIGRWVMRWLFDRPLNKARIRHGFKPERDLFFKEVTDTQALLGLWSPTFRAPAEDDPKTGTICGFSIYDRTHDNETPPAQVQAFLDECSAQNRKPIVFTLGTSIVHHHNGFYELATSVIEQLQVPAILLVGKDEYAPAKLPPMVRAFAYAPFSTLFPHASAVVHHGGVGTTAQALRSGVPTVIVPFVNDEYDNAARAARLGTSITLKAGQLSHKRLKDSLTALLTKPSYAQSASIVAGKMRSENGAATAADIIEREARKGLVN